MFKVLGKVGLASYFRLEPHETSGLKVQSLAVFRRNKDLYSNSFDVAYSLNEALVTMGRRLEGDSVCKLEIAKLEKGMVLAVNDSLKRGVQWKINTITALNKEGKIDKALLGEYVGQYREYLITANDGRLYCSNTKREGEPKILGVISDKLFSFQRDVQIEFLRGENGKIASMKMTWDDDWVETYVKKE